jgi:3-phosphoshikimate 1-carboxyvinyltransferase
MHASGSARPAVSRRAARLSGRIRVPGDKSISHRALILGGLALGRTEITGLLEGDDVLRTAAAMGALGAKVERRGAGAWAVQGVGVGGLAEPSAVLDCGNSGTGSRLLIGLTATHNFTTFFTGDASLSGRPMNRVIQPLETMGARFVARSGNRLPLAVIGAEMPIPIVYKTPVASAQVKTAVLFAGLNAPGETSVIETARTRDHTENMLKDFGAQVRIEPVDDGTKITVGGHAELQARPILVPGDPSSAAFALVAALIAPESEVTVENVCLNPLRTGLFQTLQEMGGDVTVANRRSQGGEEVGDVTARSSRLKGISIPAERAPSMIDEYPILAVAAACAEGVTRMNGVEELRVKETDRIAMMAEGLVANGAKVEIGRDWMEVTGTGAPPPGGASARTALDHRIAMSFLVLGLVTPAPVAVDDVEAIGTSFPGFVALMNGLGARISEAAGAETAP